VLSAALLIASVIFNFVPPQISLAQASDHVKILVCHATASDSNPYVSITVNIASVDDANGLNGHGDHVDDQWNSFVFDGVTYPGQPADDNVLVDNGCEVPLQASASASVGECSYSAETGSITPVSITIDGAVVHTDAVAGDLTSSSTLNLAPGDYSFNWEAVSGYTGSGTINFIVNDCTPGTASVSYVLGECSYTVESGSSTPVDITILDAVLHTGIVAGDLSSSTTLNIAPGDYSFDWEALSGFTGSGTISFTVNDCSPVQPAQPYASLSCYSLASSAFYVTVGNSGNGGEVGYSTDIDSTVISLGAIASSGSTSVQVSGDASSFSVYAMDQGNWVLAGSIGLDKNQARLCETDLISLSGNCSYLYPAFPINWTITNLGSFDISFDWQYGSDSSASSTNLPSLASAVFTTAYHSGESMQIFSQGILLASASAVQCQAFITLSLSSICAPDPVSNNAWVINNANVGDVNFEYSGSGGVSGVGTVGAGSSLTIYTARSSNSDTLSLYSGGILQDSAAAAKGCIVGNPPPPVVEIPVTPPPVTLNIPVTGAPEPTIIIPVTGIDLGSSTRGLPGALLSYSFGFLGIGMVLTGVSRRKDK
jgi:hypothetical protein